MLLPPELDPTPAATDEQSLQSVLGAWRRGDVREADVATLSDLARDESDRFAACWSELGEETRVAIARHLLALAEERVELHFGRALRLIVADPSAVVRQLAVAALWEDEGDDLPDRLLRIVAEDPSQDVVAQAVQSLAATADRAALGALDPDRAAQLREFLLQLAAEATAAPVVRRRALEAAAIFADDARIATLIEYFYEAEEAGFRASALFAMGRTADRRWLSIVSDELESDDAELRFEASRALGELGDTDAIPNLSALSLDDDPEVRQAAIGAVGRIGGRAAVQALQRLAEDPFESDVDAIEEAMLEAATTIDPLTLDR